MFSLGPSFAVALALVVGLFSASFSASAEEATWKSLFNGKDLSGWTAKITGHPAGDNAMDTFRVEDGIIKARYDKYPRFDQQFGHLYSNASYSHYRLRLEYRFVGERLADAPGYVNLNSGVMYHSQSAHCLALDQAFPVSLEFQFLADEGKGPRATGNLCTPGTHVSIDGKLVKDHIVSSSAPTFPADQWVQIELEVHGHELVIHRVNGKEVLRFQHPVLDPSCPIAPAEKLIEAGAATALSQGHIALQAEGQEVWFRKIEIMELPTPEKP
jgi:hypothetical protein